MRLLLDTHVLLWALQDSQLLGSEARELLHHAEVAYVSAASVWESHIKAELGRLTLPEGFITAIGQSGFRELPVGWEHTAAIDRIKLPHRDPFDRLLMAQAECEQLVLLTVDEVLLTTYPALCFDARR